MGGATEDDVDNGEERVGVEVGVIGDMSGGDFV